MKTEKTRANLRHTGMKSHFLAAAAALAVVLTLAGTAAAASIDDLRGLGYTVGVAFTHDKDCTVYSVSGFGNSSYFDSCDPGFRTAVDSWANPVGFCNVKWQFEHPDQFQALEALNAKHYSISGDQCADRYVVTNSFTGKAIYDGAGAGMVSVAATAEVAVAVVIGTDAPVNPVTPTPPTCLPLCPPEIAPVEPVTPPPPPSPPVTVEPTTPTAPAAEPVTVAAPSASPAAVEAATAEVELARFTAVAPTLAAPAPVAALRWQDAASLVR